jgi:hypothetical protein
MCEEAYEQVGRLFRLMECFRFQVLVCDSSSSRRSVFEIRVLRGLRVLLGIMDVMLGAE